MNTHRLVTAVGGTLLLAAAAFEAQATGDIMDQIAGYWPFDETSGGIAHEASGQGLDGTLVHYTDNEGNWVAGKIDGAIEFGGLSKQQYVHVPDFTKPTTSLSLSAWVFADSLPQWATVAANWNGLYGALNYGMYGSNPYLSDYFADTGGVLGIRIIVSHESIQAPPLSLGEWHHIVVVVDPTNPFAPVALWRDGRYIGGASEYSGEFYPAPVPHLNIGGEPTYNNPGQGYWDGEIDDLALWTRALSDEEINEIYNAGLKGQSVLSLVPEPSSAALIALVGTVLLCRRRLPLRTSP